MLKYRQNEDSNSALPYSYNPLFVITLSFDVTQSELFTVPFIMKKKTLLKNVKLLLEIYVWRLFLIFLMFCDMSYT